MNHIDTEWALTSISQVDVWRDGTMDRYGPEAIQGIVSVDVSDWRTPAANGRAAIQHSREEVCLEVWQQLKRSVNMPGEKEILRDEDLIGWFIDSDIDRDPEDPTRLANSEPLLVNETDTWRLRPEAVTAVPNFFLASDYVRTHTDLATMEAANEAARRAVNGILDADGFSGARCQIWPLHEPLALAPLRVHDAARFGAGEPWDGGVMKDAVSALHAADPVLAPIAAALGAVSPVLVHAQNEMDRFEQSFPVAGGEDVRRSCRRSCRCSATPSKRACRWRSSRTAIRAGRRRRGRWRNAPAAGRRRTGRGHGPRAVRRAARVVPRDDHGRARWRHSSRRVRAGPLRVDSRVRVAAEQGAASGALPRHAVAPTEGAPSDALPSAAGIELLHNAFLVHDDIEDGSESRRGKDDDAPHASACRAPPTPATS